MTLPLSSLEILGGSIATKLTLTSSTHIFIKLLRFYTKSPMIADLEAGQHRVESALVYWLLDTSQHYVKHPDHHLHRVTYCTRCGTFHKIESRNNYTPNLLVPYCIGCLPQESRVRRGKGHYHFRDCFNPMLAVYDAMPLEFRQELDFLVLEYYL